MFIIRSIFLDLKYAKEVITELQLTEEEKEVVRTFLIACNEKNISKSNGVINED